MAVQGRADEVRGASPQALLNLLEAHALLDCSLNPAFGAALVAAVDAGAADFSAIRDTPSCRLCLLRPTSHCH